jgi:hypothetical protein
MENMNNMNNYENDNMQNWQQQEELPSYQRELSRRQYNVLIGVHLLFGLALTSFLCFRLPYVFPQVYSVHPVIFTIGFFVTCLVGSWIATKGNYLLSIIGYAMNVLGFGAILSLTLMFYPAHLIFIAAVLTFVVVLTMTVAAVFMPNAFLSIGKVLFIALIGLAVAELVTFFMGIFYPDIFLLIGIFIFSLYVGYDWARGQQYPSTPSYACYTALQLYMDIINLFIRILRLMDRRR